MSFHEHVAERLDIRAEMQIFFKEKNEFVKHRLEYLLSADHSSKGGQAARASILALGEDFSSMIVAIYLTKFYGHVWNVIKVDARDIFMAEAGSPVIGATLDMDATKREIIQRFGEKPRNNLYV